MRSNWNLDELARTIDPARYTPWPPPGADRLMQPLAPRPRLSSFVVLTLAVVVLVALLIATAYAEPRDVIIARTLVQVSRDAYYATGKPCACPEDRTRNGRRCGGNSAHSRAGGASVYCAVTDVPGDEVQKFRARLQGKF